MLQQYRRHLTDKVIEALNVGSIEMVNLHQNTLTPDFILIGLLEQDNSMLVKLLELSYPENTNLVSQILEKLFKEQEGQAKFSGAAIQQIQLTKETEFCFQNAMEESKKMGDKFIGVDAMFLALLDPKAGKVSEILQEFGVTYNKVKQELEILRGG